MSEEFREQLEREKIESLAEFAAGVGHELNNPLAIIGGRAQLLLREIEHPEHQRELATIIAQVKRAYEMIADIRFFARPPKPEFESCDIVTLIKDFVNSKSNNDLPSGVTISVINSLHSTNQNTTLKIETDASLLLTVLDALVKNSVQSVKIDGGHISITLQDSDKSSDSNILISVEDDGAGICESIRPMIFSPYYSGRQAGRGLGFGLPKSWRIMQILGGTIRCENPVRGARFTLTLPRKSAQTAGNN